MREKLLDTRPGRTLHFEIYDSQGRSTDGYISTGEYDSGALGEIFITVAKQGDAMGPVLDQFAIAASIALQYGAPVNDLFQKFVGTRFEPAGAVTGVTNIPRCTSPLDLLSRWVLEKYGAKLAVGEVLS